MNTSLRSNCFIFHLFKTSATLRLSFSLHTVPNILHLSFHSCTTPAFKANSTNTLRSRYHDEQLTLADSILKSAFDMPPTTINDLPNVILLIIFDHFRAMTFKELPHVCQRWRNVVREHEFEGFAEVLRYKFDGRHWFVKGTGIFDGPWRVTTDALSRRSR